MEALSADLRRLRQEFDLDEASIKRKANQAWYKVICPSRLEMMSAAKVWIEDFELMDEGYAMWYSGQPPKPLEATEDDQDEKQKNHQGLDVTDHVLSVPNSSSPSMSCSRSSGSSFELVPGNPVLGAVFKDWSPGLGRVKQVTLNRDSCSSGQVQEVIPDTNSAVSSSDSSVGGPCNLLTTTECSPAAGIDSSCSLLTTKCSVAAGINSSSSESTGRWQEFSTVLSELFQEVEDQQVLLDSMAVVEAEDAKTQVEETDDGTGIVEFEQQWVEVDEKEVAVCQEKQEKAEDEQEAVPLREVLKRLESLEGVLQRQQIVIGSRNSLKPRVLTLVGLLLLLVTGTIFCLFLSSDASRGSVPPT